jgi:hypothetical protein
MPDPEVLEALRVAAEADLRYQITLLYIKQFESDDSYDAASHWYSENWQGKPTSNQRWAISRNKSLISQTDWKIRLLENDIKRLKVKTKWTKPEYDRAVSTAKSLRSRSDWKISSGYNDNRRYLSRAKSDLSWAKSEARRYKPKEGELIVEPTPPQISLFIEREVEYRELIDEQFELVRDLYKETKKHF